MKKNLLQGNFLVSAIKQKIQQRNGIRSDNDLHRVFDKIVGIDIHPLAVLISKANYLIAFGKDLKKKTTPVSLPVYMADSLLYPKPIMSTLFGEKVFVYQVNSDISLTNPQEIIKTGKRDQIIDKIKERSIELADNQHPNNSAFINLLIKDFGLSQKAATILSVTAESLAQLIRQKQDHIYTYILKNIYVPAIIGKFEVVLGNPPWLTYKDIKDIKRQDEIKELVLKEYSLVDSKESKEITNMEEASLFLVKCMDDFVMKNGRLGFVMPRSVFSAEQHSNFRESLYKKVKIKLTEIIDLDQVKKIFGMPACALIAIKDQSTKYPISTVIYSGKLPKPNISWNKFEDLQKKGKIKKKDTKSRLIYLGNRNAWAEKENVLCKDRSIIPGQSPYMKLFVKGGDLYPRPFWFVDFEVHPKFGITNPPAVKTSQKVILNPQTKPQYRDVRIFGNVEKKFLFSTMLGIDVMPFSNLPCQPVVLPIISNGQNFQILNSEEAKEQNFDGLHEWLTKVEYDSKKIRGSKSSKYDIYASIDARRKLSSQSPKPKYAVLYGAGGTYLTATAIEIKNTLKMKIGNNTFQASDFIFEHSTYYCSTKTFDEAMYLAAILNSTVLDAMIKPFQSRGLGGPRTIHSRPLEAHIPLFDSKNKIHTDLVKSFQTCNKKANLFLEKNKYINSTENVSISQRKAARIRSELRAILEDEIKDIDEKTCKILTKPIQNKK